MRKEAKLLKEKAVNSLRLSVDHFNRQWDVGRKEAVLIFLDHSFEMLMKSAILERTGKLREAGQESTYTFEKSIRIGLSDGNAKFLSENQALTLQTINGLRDAAQHYHVELSESLMYVHAQSGVTLFNDLLFDIFDERLRDQMCERVLPVSTISPTDPSILFEHEMEEIKRLLAPGKRKSIEAKSRLRGLAILDGAISGEISQPGEHRLNALTRQIRANQKFESVFPGIAAVNFSTAGSGIDFSMRIAKKEGLPVQLVPEGTPGGSVVAVKRVNELDFYSLGHKQLAKKIGITQPKLTAVLRYLNIERDADSFNLHKVNNSSFKRYSPHAIKRVQAALESPGIETIWKAHSPNRVR